MKKVIALVLAMALLATVLGGCSNKSGDDGINTSLDTSKSISLKIAGPLKSWKAMESTIQKFEKKYPNCDIEYEFVQDYYQNLRTRLQSKENPADIFVSVNIQSGTAYQDCALDLYSKSDILDLSDTHEGLIDNFKYIDSEGRTDSIYCIPMGGEMRGMFVNKTLLAKYNLSVPTNRSELLECCKTLYENKQLPFLADPSDFGQHLLYPYICNLIANSDDYQASYKKVNEAKSGISEMFRDPIQLLYDIVSKNYFDYRTARDEYNMDFSENSTEVKARNFFNVLKSGEEYTKKDDVGQAAFVTGVMSHASTYAKVKDDYHSEIDYEFVLSPVGEDGGYAYMSPTDGIAINKDSPNVDWAAEFMDFFFQKQINTEFNEENGSIPNTSDALTYIEKNYNVPAKNVTHLGTVTFDYSFYGVFKSELVDIGKMNNPKYMVDDGNGGKRMPTMDEWMKQLEANFAEQKLAAAKTAVVTNATTAAATTAK